MTYINTNHGERRPSASHYKKEKPEDRRERVQNREEKIKLNKRKVLRENNEARELLNCRFVNGEITELKLKEQLALISDITTVNGNRVKKNKNVLVSVTF